MSTITMRDMLEAGVHFGHQTNRWNPKMQPYIFGARNGVYIIDLQQTQPLFERAYNFLAEVTARGDKVMFVGTKKQAQEVVQEQAIRAGQFYVNNRWLGGTLTNYRTIRQSLDRLHAIEKMAQDGTFERLPKKEVLGLTRERTKLEKNLGGIKDMTKLPGAVFIVDIRKEHIAVAEARKLGLPVVAIVDTNCDPDLVDYVIPGNDDAIRAVRIFVAAAADACLEGDKRWQDELQTHGPDEKEKPTSHEREVSEGPGPKVEVIRTPGATPAPDSSQAHA